MRYKRHTDYRMIQPGAPAPTAAPPPFQLRESDRAERDSNLRTMNDPRPMLRKPGPQVAQLPITVYTDTGMDAQARKALSIVRRCVAADRFMVLPHFREQMAARGLLWPDVLAVLDDPADVRAGSPETLGRPKWIVAGTAADREGIEIVCVLDTDEHGFQTVFITLYRGGL